MNVKPFHLLSCLESTYFPFLLTLHESAFKFPSKCGSNCALLLLQLLLNFDNDNFSEHTRWGLFCYVWAHVVPFLDRITAQSAFGCSRSVLLGKSYSIAHALLPISTHIIEWESRELEKTPPKMPFQFHARPNCSALLFLPVSDQITRPMDGRWIRSESHTDAVPRCAKKGHDTLSTVGRIVPRCRMTVPNLLLRYGWNFERNCLKTSWCYS